MPETSGNLLLDTLSPACLAEVLGKTQEVELSIRTSMQTAGAKPRYGYFLTSGVASVVVGSLEGDSAEVSLIGNEGLTGAFSLLGNADSPADCFMQVAGSGFRIPFADLHHLFVRSEEIRSRILECVQQQALTTTQIAACNKLHEAEARLARWLLMVQDRTQQDSFLLTQEFMSQMLGTRRSTLALVAGALQRLGFLEYSRGRVTILDREKLKMAACDCYELTRRLLAGLYQPSLRPSGE